MNIADAAVNEQQYATVLPEAASRPVEIVQRRQKRKNTIKDTSGGTSSTNKNTLRRKSTAATSSSELDNMMAQHAMKSLRKGAWAVGALGVITVVMALIAISGGGGGGGGGGSADTASIGGNPVTVFMPSSQANETVSTAEDIVRAMNKMTDELNKCVRVRTAYSLLYSRFPLLPTPLLFLFPSNLYFGSVCLSLLQFPFFLH